MTEKLKLNIKITNEENGIKEHWTDEEVLAYINGFSSVREENELEKDYFFRENFRKALEIIGDIAENYGVKRAVVVPKMVHLLPHKDYIKINSSDSGACCLGRSILIDDEYYKSASELTKFMMFCHELLHANSYQAILRQESIDNNKIKSTRSGFVTDLGDRRNFKGLNEAMTVFLTNVCYYNKVDGLLNFSRERMETDRTSKNEIAGTEKDKFDHYKSFERMFLDLVHRLDEIENIQKNEGLDSIPIFIRVYFNGGIDTILDKIMKLGGGVLNNLERINDSNSKENLMRIVNFRKKYGLPEDKELNEHIKNMKK